MDSRGADAPRRLRILDVADGAAVGDPIEVDGQAVGTLTTVAGRRALGYVKRGVEVGTPAIAARPASTNRSTSDLTPIGSQNGLGGGQAVRVVRRAMTSGCWRTVASSGAWSITDANPSADVPASAAACSQASAVAFVAERGGGAGHRGGDQRARLAGVAVGAVAGRLVEAAGPHQQVGQDVLVPRVAVRQRAGEQVDELRSRRVGHRAGDQRHRGRPPQAVDEHLARPLDLARRRARRRRRRTENGRGALDGRTATAAA